MSAAVAQEGGEWFIIDSGSGLHLCQAREGQETFAQDSVALSTAGGIVKSARGTIIDLGSLPGHRSATVLKATPDVLSLGLLVDKEAYAFMWHKAADGKSIARLFLPGFASFLDLPVLNNVPYITADLVPQVTPANLLALLLMPCAPSASLANPSKPEPELELEQEPPAPAPAPALQAEAAHAEAKQEQPPEAQEAPDASSTDKDDQLSISLLNTYACFAILLNMPTS